MLDIRIWLSALTLIVGATIYPLAHHAVKAANVSRAAQISIILEVSK